MSGERFFLVRSGEIEVIDIPDALSDAMDILVADGYSADKAAEICWAAHRGGRDPVGIARHMVKLRAAIR